MQRAIRWFTLAAIIITTAGLTGKLAVQSQEEGKDKKIFSGLSFKNQTRLK